MVLPHRRELHGSMEPRPHTPMALHHYAHLAPPRPGRGRHPLQHVRTRQNGQPRAPLLSAPTLLSHTGAPNTNPHMPRPRPRHNLHPPLHLLPPHTRTTGTGTHSHAPPSETHHLQRNRGVRHPCPAAHSPGGAPHHGPRQFPPTVTCLCLGAYRKPIFLVLHLKIKLFPMFSITIDLVGKYRTQATARGRIRERTLSWTNWLVQ